LHSEETKLKISLASKGIPKTKEAIRKRVKKVTGRKHTEEAKRKISIASSNQSQESKDKRIKTCTGKKASPETLIKLSESRKNHPKNIEIIKMMNAKLSKPVLQFDLNNNFIKEWDSIAELIRKFNISKHYIQLCCNNKKENHNGFI